MAFSTPTPLVIIQSLAITMAAVAGGSNIATTLTTIPALLQSPPSLLLTQWNILYQRGLRLIVPSAVTSATLFAFLAYSSSSTKPLQAKIYGTAGVLAFGLTAFTRLAMWGINGRLMELERVEKAEGEGKKAGEGEVVALVERWGKLNFVRGFFPLAGALVGVWGVGLGH